jgi:hypothetical protein
MKMERHVRLRLDFLGFELVRDYSEGERRDPLDRRVGRCSIRHHTRKIGNFRDEPTILLTVEFNR